MRVRRKSIHFTITFFLIFLLFSPIYTQNLFPAAFGGSYRFNITLLTPQTTSYSIGDTPELWCQIINVGTNPLEYYKLIAEFTVISPSGENIPAGSGENYVSIPSNGAYVFVNYDDSWTIPSDAESGPYDIHVIISSATYGISETETVYNAFSVAGPPNQPPSASKVSPLDDTVNIIPGDTLTFNVELTDVDGNLHHVDWFLDGPNTDTKMLSGSIDTDTWTHTFTGTGPFEVVATVFDEELAHDSVSWTVLTNPETSWTLSRPFEGTNEDYGELIGVGINEHFSSVNGEQGYGQGGSIARGGALGGSAYSWSFFSLFDDWTCPNDGDYLVSWDSYVDIIAENSGISLISPIHGSGCKVWVVFGILDLQGLSMHREEIVLYDDQQPDALVDIAIETVVELILEKAVECITGVGVIPKLYGFETNTFEARLTYDTVVTLEKDHVYVPFMTVYTYTIALGTLESWGFAKGESFAELIAIEINSLDEQYYPIVITARNSKTNEVLSGSNVYVDQNFVGTTDVNGRIDLNLVEGTYQIKLVKDNYYDQTGQIIAGVNEEKTFYLDPYQSLIVELLTPQNNSINEQSIQFNVQVTSNDSPLDGVIVTIFLNDENIGSETTNINGLATKSSSLQDGEYIWYVRVEKDGYLPAFSEIFFFEVKSSFSLTVQVSGSGTTDPPPSVYTYDEGASVSVEAIPYSGWTLDHWELEGVDVGSSDHTTVIMDADHNLEAVFVEIPPTQLQLTVKISGSGSTDPPQSTYTYDEGTDVYVDALPDAGWWLSRWELDDVDTGTEVPIKVTIDQNHTLEAVFERLCVNIDESIVSESRCDIGSTQAVFIHASWSNASDVSHGTIYVNETVYALNSTGWIRIDITSPVVGKKTWNVIGVDCGGITSFVQTAPEASIVWDYVEVYDGGVSPEEVDVGGVSKVWIKARYAYDDSEFNSAMGSLYLNGSMMTWATSSDRWENSYISDYPKNLTYQVSGFSDVQHGLTTLDDTVGALVATWMSPSALNLSVDSSSAYIGYSVKLEGALTHENGSGIPSKNILLDYSLKSGSTWKNITSVATGADGTFSANWTPPDTGNYLVRARSDEDKTRFIWPAEARSCFSVLSYDDYVFSIVSNSTITNLEFSSTRNVLSFTVEGPIGTTGYTHVTISKTLIVNITELSVHIDGAKLDYSKSSDESSWIVHFTYHHSSHTIVLSLMNQPPVADANGPYSSTQGKSIIFNGAESDDPEGPISSYSWDFGDGNNGTGVTTSHTYSSIGTFTVNLTVTDENGLTDSDTTIATVSKPPSPSPPPYYPPSPPNKPPVAEAGPNQKTWIGSIVYFDGSKSEDLDGTIGSYEWDLGDGTTVSGEEVKHAYSEPGVYEVTLTVRDNKWAEDSDTCTVKISETPAPVSNQFVERVHERVRHVVNAMDKANTTVTLNTTEPVTVTILKYEGNPQPLDPIPASALPNYVDVEISNPDAVVWPIYVEMFYTDEEVEGLDEASLGIYYWFNGTWQRCSDTGVDTENNIVWAYMTADEASGSPILIGGTISLKPATFEISDLKIEPKEIEIGSKITISVNVTNVGEETGNYNVTLNVEEGLIISEKEITLQGGESERVEFDVISEAEGTYEVEIDGLTGSFEVKAPPLKPAEFISSDLSITPEEPDIGEEVDISFTVTNIGELPGDYEFTLGIEGPLIVVSREINGSLEAGKSERATYVLGTNVPGIYSVELDGLMGSFTMKALPEPEFEVSDLTITPEEIELGEEVTVSFVITNSDSRSFVFVPFVQIGDEMIMEGVELEGHESRTVSYTMKPESVGEYDVTIDGLEGSFIVEAPPPKIPLWIWITLIIAITAITLYIIWKRTPRAQSRD